MTTGQSATSDTPVACTLEAADLAAQGDRWTQLAARALIERALTSQGLRISFRPEPGVEEELRKLVAIENRCCRWADWTTEASTREVVLNVRSSGEGIAALHDMFASL